MVTTDEQDARDAEAWALEVAVEGQALRVAAMDWTVVRVGQPDPTRGLLLYPVCEWPVTAVGGQYDGGTFYCSREIGHTPDRCVATDNAIVVAVGPRRAVRGVRGE